MRQIVACRSWVVYRMTLRTNVFGGNVVCEQQEWDELERVRPGYHLLIRAGIESEQEAEKLARGTAGDPPRKPSVHRLVSSPVETIKLPH
jgi:hypothetical protein